MKVTPKYLPPDVHKLNSKELAEQLFPKKALDQIKKELESSTKRRPKKKKS